MELHRRSRSERDWSRSRQAHSTEFTESQFIVNIERNTENEIERDI